MHSNSSQLRRFGPWITWMLPCLSSPSFSTEWLCLCCWCCDSCYNVFYTVLYWVSWQICCGMKENVRRKYLNSEWKTSSVKYSIWEFTRLKKIKILNIIIISLHTRWDSVKPGWMSCYVYQRCDCFPLGGWNRWWNFFWSTCNSTCWEKTNNLNILIYICRYNFGKMRYTHLLS